MSIHLFAKTTVSFFLLFSLVEYALREMSAPKSGQMTPPHDTSMSSIPLVVRTTHMSPV